MSAHAASAEPDLAGTEDVAYAWRVLSVTGIGTILGFFDGNALPVAMPSIGRYYGVGSDTVSWLVLGYLLAVTSLILMFGRLADRIGRRRLYLLGMGVISLASVSAAASPSIGVMIGLRVLQGVGAAAILANTTALIVAAFPPRLLTLGLSLNVTVVSTSTIFAPVLAGALVVGFSWRAVFLISGPVGLIGILWAARTLRSDGETGAAPRRGGHGPAVLAAACLAALVYDVDQGPTIGWSSPRILVMALVGLAAAAAFATVERRAEVPLIDPALFRLRSRAMAFLSATCMIISNSSLTLLLSLYLQSVRGLDAWRAGLGVTASAVGVVIASPVAGMLARRIEARFLSSVGFVLVTCAVAWLALGLRVDTPRYLISVALFISGLGMGIFQGPNTASLMSTVPIRLRSIAAAVRSTIQCAAQVVGVTVGLTLVATASPANRDALVTGAHDQAGRIHLVAGFHLAFAILAAVACLGAVVSLTRGPIRGIRAAR